MLHTGMDMHKDYCVVTVIDETGRSLVEGSRIPNEEEKVKDFFSGFDEDVEVVLEAGRNWHWMCDLLDEIGEENTLCHPYKVNGHSLGQDQDRQDRLEDTGTSLPHGLRA